uniref:C2H2-type domain-containing protein n=1 Tax=Alexandrium monilatum TaxID=311494 RepID=A0A7S4SBQ2_9DINO
MSSRSSRAELPETIFEGDEGGRGRVDVLRFEDEDGEDTPMMRRPSPQDSEVDQAASSGSEELTAVPPAGAAPPPPARLPARPPRPPGVGPPGGYPGGYPAGPPRASGSGYPDHGAAGSRAGAASASPRRKDGASQGHRVSSSPSRRRRVYSSSPSPTGATAGSGKASGSSPPGSPSRRDWDAACETVIAKLHALASSKEKRKKGGDLMVTLAERIWDLTLDLRARKGTSSEQYAAKLLREVMSLMDVKDLKDTKCIFKLARSALSLLQMEGATKGVHSSGVQAAYLNIAQVLFKYSQKEGYDADFLKEGLLEPLLEVLQSESPECTSNDLRVYIVGVLKNVSHEDANQKHLAQHGAVAALFGLIAADRLTGSSKEAQLLIQITATLRNLAGPQYRQFLQEDRLNALTRLMALFPGHTELLTNVARILSKLTLHTSACEAMARSDAHVRQISRTLSASVEAAPLTLRLAFVLGNLTERCERLRVVFAFDCEGTALVPQLLGRYWQRERKLGLQERERGQTGSASVKEAEEVLVKLVRLLANMAISTTAGSTLASSSAVVDPLLDMLGAKRIGESEELVLNVVAAVTNLLFYDVPSNLLFQEDSKQLLCRLFRPLLLESYNVEALIETARALGNLSRHADARKCMATLRLDEILVILLDHEDRDLVFYVCGALVNLAADPDCTTRLMSACPVVEKLAKLLGDAPLEDTALQLVAVKVLTNLSLDPSIGWPAAAVGKVRGALEQIIGADGNCGEGGAEGEDQQLGELSRHLLGRLPQGVAAEPPGGEAAGAADGPAEAGRCICPHGGCGRVFSSEEKLSAHLKRRHSG